MNFENLLLSKGYIPHGLKKVNGTLEWIPLEKYFYSTMGNVWVKFINGENYFIFGLNEVEKPATLIYPRPKITNGDFICRVEFDDDMNRLLLEYSSEEIYIAIKKQTYLVLEDSQTEKLFNLLNP